MVHEATGDALVYNGEIYNFAELRQELISRGHGFRGSSDTEVLLRCLAEWGPAAVERLDGMYAFAYFRAAGQELLLCRDPLGIKPLYVGRGRGVLMFASETKALMATGLLPPALDPRGTAGFFAYGACQHPFTPFEAVQSLDPGTCATLRPGDDSLNARRFWCYPKASPAVGDVREAVRETLAAAVRRHLVSDAPLAVSLSSGLDSTIVAALAARHQPALKSFTVGFAEHPDLSELGLARETAAIFGLEHNEIRIEAADALGAASQWFGALDLPSIDGLNVYVISQAIRERGAKVFLSGQGGDELFGGYASFRDVPRLHALLRPLAAVPAGARGGLARLATLRASEVTQDKAVALARSDGSLLALYSLRRRLMSQLQLADLGIRPEALGLTEECLEPEVAAGLDIERGDPVWTVGQLETRLYLGNMLLRDGDANSMAHGVELRVPFLDRRVLELAAALPGGVRLAGGAANKPLLRETFADVLRPDLLRQGKRGFTLPIRQWMQGPLREACLDGLEHLQDCGLVEPQGVRRIWEAFCRAPQSQMWTRAFACCVLGRYLQDATGSAAQRRAS